MSYLEANGITVRIDGRDILNNASSRFESGCVTAIVGPNGAGKSTFLDCVAQLRKPTSGRIGLDAQYLSEMPSRLRGRRLGYLPQNSEIAWDVDVETLVGLGRTPYTGAWGLNEDDLEQVEQALMATGTEGFRGRSVSSLSGGERARVLIARALAGQPQWLLADEPLAGLDPGHVLDVVDLFKDLARRGLGIIVTLHDLGVAMRMADRVIVMEGGKVIADGEPLSALTPEVLRQAYGIESDILNGPHGPVLDVIGRTA